MAPRSFVEYALPIAFPLPSGRADVVTARMFDPETGRGLPGVFVRLGDRLAVTDRRGLVGFSELPPGEHLMRVEPAAGSDLVTTREMPISLTIGAGAAPPRIDIGLAPAASVTGVVVRVPRTPRRKR